MTNLLFGIDQLFDLVFRLLKPLPALLILAVFSILTAVLSLVVIRWTSNQRAIRRTKNLIGAHFLEVRLFSDQPHVVLRAYFRLLGGICLYLRHVMVPVLVLAVPLLLILGQLEDRFEHAPVAPNRDFLLSANFRSADSVENASLRLPDGLAETAPAVHIPSEREVDWRVQGSEPGSYEIQIALRGSEVSKRVVIGSDDTGAIVPERVAGGLWQHMISPREFPLPRGGFVERIRIQYPLRSFGVGPWKVGWIPLYAVFTLVAALLLRGALRTEI